MYTEDFPIRLARLREQRGVSARDMSLSIGQNAGYINNIENGKALPSMTVFFYICDYLDITPSDFFELHVSNPGKQNHLIKLLEKLSDSELEHITLLVNDLVNKK